MNDDQLIWRSSTI